MKKLYIGIMSGTSMDAIDAALVDFSDYPPQLIETHKSYLSDNLRHDLSHLCRLESPQITQLAELDLRVAQAFTDTTKQLLAKTDFSKKDILAIGSHGQTVFHYPQHHYPFTLQIGDPNTIAEKTGITAVADFRRRDIACGGQGAPLTPAFHNVMFRTEKEDRIILNLGGIANVTYLPANAKHRVIGFDTGPANLLLDKWTQKHRKQWFDKDGSWAASGTIDNELLQQLLADPYFHLAPPKSTGHDYFNLTWLAKQLAMLNKELSPTVIQTTLCELTAASIGLAIQQLSSKQGRIVLCGGGCKNSYLKERLKNHCANYQICLSDELGVPGEWLEAMTFAWLAKQTLEGQTSNLPSVTGAKNATILGGIYLRRESQ